MSRAKDLLLAGVVFTAVAAPSAAGAAIVESSRSGNWSDRQTWVGRRVPRTGDAVRVRAGHTVRYDAASSDVITSILINGTLTFAPDQTTRLEVGLVVVAPDAAFDLGMACSGGMAHQAADPMPALEVGTPERPVRPGVSAIIRLHAVSGLDPDCAPAIVSHGGRLDFHGAPLARTWVKLAATAAAGTSVVELAEPVGWNVGDQVLLTGTFLPPGLTLGNTILNGRLQPESERVLIAGLSPDGRSLTLDRALAFTHGGVPVGEDMIRGEVANLSRNVVVESADPAGVRGHTMYHLGSAGSISYTELRHLGKEGLLGRYPIHFHLVQDSMRGSSVVGASVWDSANRWVVIHGTEFITIRDTVGFGSIGHGFFLENGSEVYNLLQGNLGVQAYIAEPLPNQALSYDQNLGACFWTANARNFVIGNTFAECDNELSFILEYAPGNQPMPISVRQPDGTREVVDVRSLSGGLIRDLEVHSTWGWGPWVLGSTYPPDEPLVFQNTRLWNMHYAADISGDNVVFDGVEMVNAPYGFYNRFPGPHLVRNAYFEHVSPHGAFMVYLGGHGTFLYEDVVLKSSELAVRMDAKLETGADGQPIQIHGRRFTVLDPVFIGPTGTVRTAWTGTEDQNARADPLLMLVLHDLFGPLRDGVFLPAAQSPEQDGVPPGLTFMDATGIQDGGGVLLEGRGSVQWAEAQVAWPESPLEQPVDRLPPATAILSPRRGSSVAIPDGSLRVCGVAMDQFGIARVSVNGLAATLEPDGFGWCATLSGLASGPLTITAIATDRSGLVELTPHTVAVEAVRDSIDLSATGSVQKGKIVADLAWQGGTSSTAVTIWRAVDGGSLVAIATNVPNTGTYRDDTKLSRANSIAYVVCDPGQTICSNTVLLEW